jgi:hypothetical protein
MKWPRFARKINKPLRGLYVAAAEGCVRLRSGRIRKRFDIPLKIGAASRPNAGCASCYRIVV